METLISFLYVDDLRLFLYGLNNGWRWKEGQFQYSLVWEEEDRESGLTSEQLTAREMRKVMDSIYPELKFEMETPSMFDGKLPTLDFSCWLEGHQVLYSFYQKPMARKTVINKSSALSEKTKVSSLSQDLIRRMKNTSENIPILVRIEIVNDFSNQLLSSGYSFHQTRDIIEAGLKGYESLLKKCEKGEAKLHRSAEEGAGKRMRKKLLGKSTWFLKKEKELKESSSMTSSKKNKISSEEELPNFSTVMFVSQTPNGMLAKRLQKVENSISKLTGERIKIVERSGTTIKKLLIKSNPWAGGLCGRDKCLSCLYNDKPQNCFAKGVVYDITCKECKERAVDSEDVPVYRYTGTTSRSLYQRGKEHLSGFLKKDDNNALYKHSQDKHDGDFVEFEMEVIKQHFSAFSRIIHESVRINRNSRDKSISVLNSKSEWGFNKLPRLVVEKEDNDKASELDLDMNDCEVKAGSNGGRRQFEFQSRNSNFLKSWTPSTNAANKPNVVGEGNLADKKRRNQMTMHSFFKDIVK